MKKALEQFDDALNKEPNTNVTDMLLAKERQTVLYDWNATKSDYPKDKCIHELFEEQVAKTPDAVAVVYEDEQLTYMELNSKANQLAHYLHSMGVCPDSLVGLCVERGLNMIIGIMGILKAGGAYVPLDPNYPTERLVFMLKDCDTTVVLVEEATSGAFTHIAGENTVLNLTLEKNKWNDEPNTNLEKDTIHLSPKNLAYIIYTSGTTGQPKGVMIEHGGLVNQIIGLKNHYRITSEDCILQFSRITFDMSVEEIFPALVSGARLVIRTDAWLVGSQEFWGLCKENGVTITNLPTKFWSQLIQDEQVVMPSSLRQVMITGEAVSTSALTKWFKLKNRPRLFNVYGPTETTVNATIYEPLLESLSLQSIGRPMANTYIYILDKNCNPVPIGVAGELYIGGVNVGRGYLNRPDITEERFVQDPFAQANEGEPVPRMYKSGDLARWLPDGTIEYLGRIDFQVKIRGFRIELGEIEVCLAKHPHIQDVIVIAREDGPVRKGTATESEKRLVAYYVAEEALPVEELRKHVLASLPEYMVPNAYVRLERMPLNSNGKLDRGALPAPEGDGGGIRTYEAPQCETEEKIAQIWSELLSLEKVGRYDNFFELGGHSLLAITLIERLRKINLYTDIRNMFTSANLADLAIALTTKSEKEIIVPPNQITEDTKFITPDMLPLINLTQQDIDYIVDTIPGGISNIQDIYALGPMQEGMLFHHLLEKEADPYTIGNLMAFDSRERLDKFLDSMQTVIDRHDILRTSMVWKGLTEPAQVVWRKAVLSIQEVIMFEDEEINEIDINTIDFEKIFYERINPRSYRFDLEIAPFVRAFITYDLREKRWLLLLLEHHLLGDSSIMSITMEEIIALQKGQVDILLTPKPFRNYIAQTRLGKRSEEHEDFFRNMLGDIDEPTVPFGLTNILGEDSSILESDIQLNDNLAQRIRACAKTLGGSPASLFHLAWAQVLSVTSGRQQVVFGTVLFGRMQGGRGSDRTLGLFINTLPILIDINGDSVYSSAKRVHSSLIELLTHEHAQLTLAQRCSKVTSGTPLFTAIMNYRYGVEKTNIREKWEGIEFIDEYERTNYPFILTVDDLSTSFLLNAQTDSAISPERVCNFLISALESIVEAIETAPDTPVCDINILSDTERKTVLYELNATKSDYPKDKCIHELFEEQVAKTPDAAVVYEDEQLTYRELNSKANKLSHYLRSLGVGPDSLVGLCVERGLNMMIGVMGIIKAGGAYVPLDQNYPAERLAFMLDDCAPIAVLVDSTTSNVFADISVQITKVNIILDQNKWSELPHTNLEKNQTHLTPKNLAYIIYTSGTTGQPKGVMIEHGGLVNQIAGLQRYYKIGSDDKILQFASITFDVSVEEIFTTLISGARLVIRTEAWLTDAQEFWKRCKDKGITIANLPTLFWNQLIQDEQVVIPDTLQKVIVGSEAISSTGLLKWFKNKVRPRLFNAYGPTETTINATIHEPLPESLSLQAIGKPVANTHIYILDKNGVPAPIGVSGEIYIGGVNLARGYLNRPELTAERFLPDLFARSEEEFVPRMYKTGDLARWLPDGNIEYIGRTDFQVKIRGFRIELGEIEARLLEYPYIREVAVIAREDVLGDKELVTYYVAKEVIHVEELRKHLSERLPDYMLPAAYIRLNSMPLTPSGKLDRKALPAPGKDAYMMRPYEPPQGEIEEIIAETWSQLFKLEQVGRDDNFFELGGHSLLSIQLMSLLRKKGIDISISMVFKYQTIKLLSSAVTDKKENINNSCVPLRTTGTQTPLFLVHEAFGDAVVYGLRLTEHIEDDIPVYALDGQPLDESFYKTSQAIAQRHIQKIQEVQPKGPYRIAGWSYGGLLAYEIAKQLIGQDEIVEFLGLLDTYYEYGLSKNNPQSVNDDKLDEELDEELDFKLFFLGFIKGVGYYKSIMDEIKRDFTSMSLYQFVNKVKSASVGQIDFSVEDTIKTFTRFRIFMENHNKYCARKLPIKPYIFSAQDETNNYPYRGWDTLLSQDEIQVIPVPGDHFSMTIAYAKNLGKAISQAIQESSNEKNGNKSQQYESLVTIQTGNSGNSPIFCVPGSVNYASAFCDLADVLGAFIPVYGFEPRGLAGEFIPHQSVSAATNTYIQEIRNKYPNGPLHLFGHSFGGWIVFEMAQQLCAEGSEVLSVTMVDAEIPDKAGGRLREYSRVDVLMKLVDIYQQIAGSSLNLKPKDFDRLNQSEQLPLLHEQLVLAGLMSEKSQPEMLERIMDTFESNLHTHYTPKDIFHGNVQLIFAKENAPSQLSIEEIALQWKYWAPNLTYKEMEGNHMTILKSPYVYALAEELKIKIGKYDPILR